MFGLSTVLLKKCIIDDVVIHWCFDAGHTFRHV